MKLRNISLFLLMVLVSNPALADVSVTLNWNAPTTTESGSPLNNLAGFKLYRKTQTQTYDSAWVKEIPSPSTLTTTSHHLKCGETYNFAITALSSDGQESVLSSEITYVAHNSSCPTLDTDGDGVNDDIEVTDGTNPNDSGDYIVTPETSTCAEWNGFLGMHNLYEFVNTSESGLSVALSLKSQTGEILSTDSITLAAGSQLDYPVNTMPGFNEASYGLFCAQHSGNEGDLDGRMMFYRTEGADFQFAFAAPMTNGRVGSQFTTFNTHQPSFVPRHQNNLVANWIQVTNLENTTQDASLLFYDQSGKLLETLNLRLNPGERSDIDAHRFGSGIVGLVELSPENGQSRMILRNTRYLYDNPVAYPDFYGAFQLEGVKGTGETQFLPLDTRGSSSILELTNTLDRSVDVEVRIRKEDGKSLFRKTMTIQGKASFHLITDTILGEGERGLASIDGKAANSIAAVVMNYARTPNGGISNIYGISAEVPRGSVKRGSYNTFIEQESELILINTVSETQSLSIDLVNYKGQFDLSSTDYVLPQLSLFTLRTNDYAANDTYGVATVDSDQNSTVGWILRKRGTDYIAPTPIR